MVQNAFIHNELTIFRDLYLKPVQRPWSRTFKVCPVFVEAAPMARAFKLVLGRQPPRRRTLYSNRR